ncbi:hypothetical protein F4778DRAFT_93335 [Xylariomycetidae sp. FL2044]|nr:hypothetical protein F4778DRAFT_93335 [Xylariomycetidae sp. FL2044]
MSPEGEAQAATDILNTPSAEPPAGVIPNFSEPGGSHVLGYSVVIIAGVLSTLAVLTRLASRFVVKTFKVEDAFLIIALGMFAGLAYTNYAGAISPGVAVHQWNVPIKDLGRWFYLLHIASVFYGLGMMFLKLAILYDWLRIFVPTGQRSAIFWTIHILIWCNIVFYVSGTFFELFQCTPAQKIWDPLFEGGSCSIDINANNFASSLINLVSDIAVIAVPQWVIWNLKMPRWKRIAVSVLFVIGVFATACGLARFVYLLRILDSSDAIYNLSILGLWGVGEMAAGFLIIGIPAAPKAAQTIPFSESVGSLLRSWTRRDGSSSYERRNVLSWRKPTSRRRRGQWSITDLETHDLVTLDTIRQANDGPQPTTVTGGRSSMTLERTNE